MSIYIILIAPIFFLPESLANSPSFIRNVIDNNFDYWNVIEPWRGSISKNNQSFSHVPSLESVSYSSNGTFLNTTFFLSETFEPKPTKHIPSYIMWIDVDNDNKTGMGRADYGVIIEWNNTTKVWNRIVMEFSHDEAKVLQRNYNYTDFSIRDNIIKDRFDNLFKISKNFVNLYLDLEEINYPDKYNLGFVIYETIKNDEEISMYDTTTWITVPPPKFNVSLSPSSLQLRPNEEKTVKLDIKSDTTLQPKIDLKLGSYRPSHISSVSILPNKTILAVDGISSSDLIIRSSQNAAQDSFTLPISLKVSFLYVGNQGDAGLVIDQSYYLPITILPAVSILDIIFSSINTLSLPMQQLAQIVSAIGTLGISGLLFKVLRKKLLKNKGRT